VVSETLTIFVRQRFYQPAPKIAIVQAYVLTPAYVGRDRRVTQRTRLIERRRVDAGELAPSLAAALRQLGLRAIELDSQRTAPSFMERLYATRALAQTRGQSAVSGHLSALCTLLETRVEGRASELAEGHLREAACALG
jgi:hypothetical protein